MCTHGINNIKYHQADGSAAAGPAALANGIISENLKEEKENIPPTPSVSRNVSTSEKQIRIPLGDVKKLKQELAKMVYACDVKNCKYTSDRKRMLLDIKKLVHFIYFINV